MLNKLVRIFGGDPNARIIEELSRVADQINAMEEAFEALSDRALRAKTDEFRARLADGETLDDILPEAFAAVREASKRTLGLRHYDIQLIGGIVLHQGKIAEMRTGEGKTLVSTLPIYLNALTGRGVHLVTVNDYLARRDARWMAPIYHLLGMSVGVLQMAARTEHGKKAFLVDLDKSSPHEDQHQLVMVPRKMAYDADITYGTTSEFGFDYLRDNMSMRWEERVQRPPERGGHHFAIIDEVDNVLIDEARTPLIISGPSHDQGEEYIRMAQVVKQLNSEDYEVDEKSRSVALTEIGEIHVEQILGEPLRDPERPEDITPEQAQKLGYLEQALRAQYVYKRNRDYIVQGGKVIIVDENTGRMMPGRRWSDGLHQAVEAKEGVKVQSENVTYATITIQNYYRKYQKLSGMTGTAATEAEEFDKIYGLEVVEIPPHLEYLASRPDHPLKAFQARDEEGYEYTYYATEPKPKEEQVLFKRKDYPDVIYRTEEAKFRAIAAEIMRFYAMGRPMLVGTTSVELSERLSSRLKAEPMRRLAQVMLLRDTWMEVNHYEEDGRQIEELKFLNRPLGLLPVATMRKMARELGLSLDPARPENLERLRKILRLPEQYNQRLASIFKSGIPHQVLNARKHTEESKIIAGAGAYGAVTIATNMAGRGVDIKLGGELPEEVLTTVNRVLKRAGYEDPYDMSLDERETALRQMDASQYGIYEDEIQRFLKYIQESKLVKELGGLHVIGSERHEARRIDNQLRGRSGRQGDPGSSRFYLSMQDNLMRLFGGQQAEALMERLKIDDAMPIEMKMVSRIVEQSQTRVEGANFDTRKHLLEYDDVLNSQRETIYQQRDRIFLKDDLTADVTEMLRAEVERRVPEAMADLEGPWKLLAWLEQVQPPLIFGSVLYPSYTMHLLLEYIQQEHSPQSDEEAIQSLLEIAEKSLEAERDHLLTTVEQLLERALEQLDQQIRERVETLDIFFDGLAMESEYEDETPPRSLSQLQEELITLLRVPLRLSKEELRMLRQDAQAAAEMLEAQVENYLAGQTARRIIAAVERRLEESLELRPEHLSLEDWEAFGQQIQTQVEQVYRRRYQRYFGEQADGQIVRELHQLAPQLRRFKGTDYLLNMLLRIPQGARATFDRRTRRRVWQRTTRLTYIHYAATLLEGRDENEVFDDVMSHLSDALQAMRRGWGWSEFERLAHTLIRSLPEKTRNGLKNVFGEADYTRLESLTLRDLSPSEREVLVDELGRQALTEIFRQLLLGVITEQWVDYLTQMEALRVSVGLEAYAQRDPLVIYKSKASEMFHTLVNNIRISVVSRMFTYFPRDLSAVQAEATVESRTRVREEAAPTPQAEQPQLEGVGVSTQKPVSKSKKRRRRRRRK